MTHALADGGQAANEFDAFVTSYLLSKHKDARSDGCPLAAFSPDVRHQKPEARAAMNAGVEAHIARISATLEKEGVPDARNVVIASWSAMVGAMVLARAVEETALSDEFLHKTRDWIAAALNR